MFNGRLTALATALAFATAPAITQASDATSKADAGAGIKYFSSTYNGSMDHHPTLVLAQANAPSDGTGTYRGSQYRMNHGQEKGAIHTDQPGAHRSNGGSGSGEAGRSADQPKAR
ncbi:MAG: hypothetical protein J0H14_07500 [Alphaproteobacteria bacterium]|nr:hypothetical protein [Alphaproteobacteria bacterium]